MSTIRTGTQLLRRLSFGGQSNSRGYTHLTQPTHSIEQQGLGQSQSKSEGWGVPATLVLVGLGFSTFSTHQLISGNDTVKMLSSPSKK